MATGKEFIESVCKSVNESLNYDDHNILLSSYDDDTLETELFRNMIDLIPEYKKAAFNNDHLANNKDKSPDYDKYIMLLIILRICAKNFDLIAKLNKLTNQTEKDM